MGARFQVVRFLLQSAACWLYVCLPPARRQIRSSEQLQPTAGLDPKTGKFKVISKKKLLPDVEKE
jgi:hypothetical protein